MTISEDKYLNLIKWLDYHSHWPAENRISKQYADHAVSEDRDVIVLNKGIDPLLISHVQFATHLLREKGFIPDLIALHPYQLSKIMQDVSMRYNNENPIMKRLLDCDILESDQIYAQRKKTMSVIWVLDTSPQNFVYGNGSIVVPRQLGCAVRIVCNNLPETVSIF